MGRLNIPADNKGINLKCCLCINLNARKLSGCKSKMFYLIPKQTPITLTLHVVKGKHDVYKPGCLTPKGRTVSASGSATTLVLGAAIKLFNFKERIVLKTRTTLQMMLAYLLCIFLEYFWTFQSRIQSAGRNLPPPPFRPGQRGECPSDKQRDPMELVRGMIYFLLPVANGFAKISELLEQNS